MRCRCHLRARASLRNRHLGPSIMGSEDEAEQPGFQSDPLEAVGGVPQNLQKDFRLARYLHFLHDPPRVIHNADAGLLDRYVQSTKMVHAALLLLMLEAVTTDLVFTISLKRSTQNLQLSTTWAGRLHHLWGQKAKYSLRADVFRFGPNNGHRSIGSACPWVPISKVGADESAAAARLNC